MDAPWPALGAVNNGIYLSVCMLCVGYAIGGSDRFVGVVVSLSESFTLITCVLFLWGMKGTYICIC